MLSFKATIYKVGINPCVTVPFSITARLTPVKGYIPVEGTLNGFNFKQNLVPVKGDDYRLYVNGPMLKGSGYKVGDKANISIRQDLNPEKKEPAMIPAFKKELNASGAMSVFNNLIPSRRKEILKYLGSLKTEEALNRNIGKVIKLLQKHQS